LINKLKLRQDIVRLPGKLKWAGNFRIIYAKNFAKLIPRNVRGSAIAVESPTATFQLDDFFDG
jgi:hypothetical protein